MRVCNACQAVDALEGEWVGREFEVGVQELSMLFQDYAALGSNEGQQQQEAHLHSPMFV